MTESSDGFLISEQDLKLRGAGEMFGRKQSGDAGFALANLYEDINILRCAKQEAVNIIKDDSTVNRELVNEISRNYKEAVNIFVLIKLKFYIQIC